MSGKSGQTKAETEARRKKVFEHWSKGINHCVIAERLGVDVRTIQRDLEILRARTLEDFRKTSNRCMADMVQEFDYQNGLLAELQEKALANDDRKELLKLIYARQEHRWKYMNMLHRFGEINMTEKPPEVQKVVYEIIKPDGTPYTAND